MKPINIIYESALSWRAWHISLFFLCKYLIVFNYLKTVFAHNREKRILLTVYPNNMLLQILFICKCFFKNLHLYVFSPVCMIRCCVRLSFPVNVLSHYSHTCNWYSLFFAFFILIFFLWLCVTCCVFLFKFSLVGLLSHTLQLYGLSLVWGYMQYVPYMFMKICKLIFQYIWYFLFYSN